MDEISLDSEVMAPDYKKKMEEAVSQAQERDRQERESDSSTEAQ